MNLPEARVRASRAARDAAKAEFDTRLAQVKADLETRGLGGRVADKLAEGARTAAGQALEVAEDSKGIIAGTIALLVLWFLRNPIVGWIGAMIAAWRQEEETGDDQE